MDKLASGCNFFLLPVLRSKRQVSLAVTFIGNIHKLLIHRDYKEVAREFEECLNYQRLKRCVARSGACSAWPADQHCSPYSPGFTLASAPKFVGITHRPDMRPALAARQIYFDPPSAVWQNIAYPSGYVRGNKALSAPAGAIWKT